MSLLNAYDHTFAGTGDKSFRLPHETPSAVLMVAEDENVADQRQPSALLADEDARAFVRLVQCTVCSRPFRIPVTLPCGHSLCRSCLPASQARPNVSYPNAPDRQQGITCTLPECGAEHAIAECNIDVTLVKFMDAVALEVQKHRSLSENAPISIDEVVQHDDDVRMDEEKDRTGHSRVLHGGRLVATYVLAELGELEYQSGASYQPMADSSIDYNKLDLALMLDLREVTQKELDCQVCYNMMLDPVTTPCGHTFCRKCLARVLDHSRDCPMCRRTLPIPPNLERQSSNIRLVALLNGVCPDVVAARMDAISSEEQWVGTNTDVALFVCTISLPTMPTYLHIFEPRYRLMIRRAMEANRQFGMLLYNRTGASQGSLGATQFLEYGTMLEITNIQMMPDGRSFIETKGVYRFRVLSHGNRDGYTIGNVERIEDVSLAEEERLEVEDTTAAAEEIQRQSPSETIDQHLQLRSLSTRELLVRGVSFVERARAISANWVNRNIITAYGGPPDDPAQFPFWFATVLPIAEEEKYRLLSTRSVRERLKIINGWIQRIESQRWCVTSPLPPLIA